MHSGRLISKLALGLATPAVMVMGLAAPANAATPGDPGPATSAAPLSAAALAATTGIPCGNNGTDKTLTRSQVLIRAKSWLADRIPYSQERCFRNTYGDYRTDCSGFVSMAWGLGGSGSDFWTGNLDTRSKVIPRSDLRPGDALLRHTGDPHQNHVALFVRWADTAHTSPIVMEQTPRTNPDKDPDHDTKQDAWRPEDAAKYTPVRYDNIVEDGAQPSTMPDISGDGFADLIVRSGGDLTLYLNNIGRDDGVPYSNGVQIGHGWAGYNLVVTGDVTGDGFTDLIGRNPDGSLWLYANSGRDGDVTPFSAGVQIGRGFANFDKVIAADVTGDNFADLVVRNPDGSLWLYANSGTRGDTSPFNTGRQIGRGFAAFDTITVTDVSGDGFADLVVRSGGDLTYYPNNIGRDNGTPYGTGVLIGHGWAGFASFFGADVTGDGFADLVARGSDGSLTLYANSGKKGDASPYSAGKQIGRGFAAFDTVTA
jgi:FG-GAP-like repeat